ncbi:fibronectin type III domain-containing protein, partial [Stenotrophomonas maltophilia group sp. RNC7]|uniref:fibronectin type III domain-containing protein n=1 Tax=Stenotrophomonas maltophilia group sp. RNC7 TaxID=3071467 RepID=UPI0027DEC8AC
ESLKNYFIKTMQAPHRMDIDAVNIKCSTLRDLELAFLQMLKKEIFEGVVLTNNNKTLDSVTNLNVIHRTDTSIWISWTDKLKESQLVKYEIYLNGKIVDTCSSEQCIIEDLDSNTTYEIAVITKGLFDLM